MQSKKTLSIQRLLKTQSLLQCPMCKEDIHVVNNQCVCSNKHTFDVAKKGYVNFALAKGDPFYNTSLFLSRKKMLHYGLFDELIHQTFLQVKKYSANCRSLMDVGCGEGYYLNRVVEKLHDEIDFVVGVDLSKDAISLATSESQNINWFVADLTNIPCKDESMDVILNVFTPANYNEFYRVLKEDGLLIKIVPFKSHFIELRQALNIKEYDYENIALIESVLSEKFDVISKEFSTSTIATSKDMSSDLINMSPLSRQSKHVDAVVDHITVDAIMYTCRKKKPI